MTPSLPLRGLSPNELGDSKDSSRRPPRSGGRVGKGATPRHSEVMSYMKTEIRPRRISRGPLSYRAQRPARCSDSLRAARGACDEVVYPLR